MTPVMRTGFFRLRPEQQIDGTMDRKKLLSKSVETSWLSRYNIKLAEEVGAVAVLVFSGL